MAREVNENLRHIPRRHPSRLLHRPPRRRQRQTLLLVRLDKRHPLKRLVPTRLLLPLRLPLRLLDNDRLRRNRPHRRGNQRSGRQSPLGNHHRTNLHLHRRLALHHSPHLLRGGHPIPPQLPNRPARRSNLLQRPRPPSRLLLYHLRRNNLQLHRNGRDARGGTRVLGRSPRRDGPVRTDLDKNPSKDTNADLCRVVRGHGMYLHQPDRIGLVRRHRRDLQRHRDRI